MTIRQVTLPTAEPISLAEAKTHLRGVAAASEDALISALIVTAREQAEALLNRAIVARTWEKLLDAFPDAIELLWPPVRSVLSIKYLDANGAEQTLSPASYSVDKHATPGWIVPAFNTSWPVTRADINAVRVRYAAGMVIPFTVNTGTDFLTATGHGYANDDEVPVFAGGAIPVGLTDGGQYFAKAVTADTLQLAAAAGGAAIDITGAGTPPNFLGQLPRSIRSAMLLMLTHWFEHRSDVAERQLYEVPKAAEDLLRPNSMLVV